MGLCSLERRRLEKILSTCLNTRREEIMGKETDFSLVFSDRTRGNGHKTEYKKCFLNMNEGNFLTMKFKHWPREYVKSPSS